MALRLNLFPNYYSGFTYTWKVDASTMPDLPWNFRIEESEDGLGGWADISGVVNNKFAFTEEVRSKHDKDTGPYFRVQFINTGEYSPVITVFGDLPKNEFLLAQEIIRKEHLAMANMTGVEVLVWKKMHTGVKCVECINNITGEIMDSNCRNCHGTGFLGGYHGPYCSLAKFDQRKITKRHESSGAGVDDTRIHQVRMTAAPHVVRDDLIVEVKSQLVYTVDKIVNTMELRRIPIVRDIEVHENNRDEVEYDLSGTAIACAAGVGA